MMALCLPTFRVCCYALWYHYVIWSMAHESCIMLCSTCALAQAEVVMVVAVWHDRLRELNDGRRAHAHAQNGPAQEVRPMGDPKGCLY